jgi:uncharacterized membrane protein
MVRTRRVGDSTRMRDRTIFYLTFVAALSTGMVSGVFFGFSSFVMKALGRLPPPQGIEVWKSIDVVVVSSTLMPLMFGAGLICIILAVMALVARDRPDAMYLLIGAIVYFVGNIIVTMVANVPLNDAVDALDPATADSARFWADFLVSWTFWNSVRWVTALIAAAAFTAGLLRARG